MKILWFTWKDRTHPLAGGAEVVNEELGKRLAADGHEVIYIVGGYKGGAAEEVIDGYKVVRLGNRYTVYWKAFRYYQKHLKDWADLVIDEVNTVPFFCKLYVKERNILFVHMLCRIIWFYEMRFPLSLVGYLIEPLYLRLLNDRKVITVSNSTKKDMMRHGFKAVNIDIISEGIEIEPLKELPPLSDKFPNPTLLSLGAMRPMKRTLDQIKAFELAKKNIPNLKLVIAGDSNGKYGHKVLKKIAASPYVEDIHYKGKVSKDEKNLLLRKCHAILVTSVKEGWGLVVTEANAQGTPAIVYDVDGLRDSVKNEVTGYIAYESTPQSLKNKVELAKLFDNSLRNLAIQDSKRYNFMQCYQDFITIVKSNI